MPIVSAIGAAVAAVSSWTITLGTLGTFAVGNFLIRSVVQVGLSALMVKAMGKPKTAPFSIQSQVRSGGIVPRSFIMGRTGTAGSLVWHSEWGKAGKTPNAYYTRVIALSDLPIAGLAKVFVGGVPVTLGPEVSEWGHPVEQYKRDNRDHLWIKFYDGTQTVADPFLVNTVGPQAAVPYEASRRGEGVAYAIVTSRIDEKLFTGFPEAFFVLDGVPLYDPSRDSSVGGSGAQRYNDPTTWGGDGDHYPAVQAYNINRGISYKGQWFYGLQSVSAARLPAANWISQIEKCRIQIEGADGLEPAFRSGGEILVDTEIGKTQEEILACCSGRMSERGGTFKILVGAPDPAVATITDGDILDTSPQGQDPFQSLSETMNGLIATYPNPDEAFKSRQAPPVFRPDLEAEDGGRRLMGRVSLNMAPYPAQVQRLIDAEIRAARRAVRHSHTLPARFSGLEPNDTIEFVSARNGYASKLFRIDFVSDLENCDIAVDLTEIDPSDHAQWNAQTDYVAPQPGDVPSGGTPPQVITGWSVTAAASTDAQGAGRFPAIAVGWDGDMDDVIAVEVRVRVKTTGAMIFSGRFEDVAAAAGLIVAGILPVETYEAQGRYVPGSSRETVWSDWLEVTTLDLRITRDQLHDEIGASLDQAEQDLLQLAQDLGAARQAAADAVGGLFATGFFGDIWSFWSLNGSKLPGTFYPSGNLYEFTVSDVQNAGLQLWSDQAGWVGAAGADRYLLELEFELLSGATSGAGVLFDWRNTNNQLFRVAVPLSDFVSEPIVAGQRYFGSVLVERPVDFAGTFDRHSVYLMANFGQLGALSAKTIRFHKFQSYPATITDALTAQHAGAITDLQGNSAAAITFRVKAGGAEGDLELVAWDNLTGAGTALLANIDQFALRGSISSDKLTVGLPTQNMIPDPMFLNPSLYNRQWLGGGVTLSYRESDWRPSHGPSVQLFSPVTGDKAGGLFGNVYFTPIAGTGAMTNFPVKGGNIYQFSIQASAHRAVGMLAVEWYDSDNNWLFWHKFADLGEAGNTATWGGNSGDKEGVDNWPRFGRNIQAPAGAAYARLRLELTGVHGNPPGDTSGYIFGHSPVFKQAFSLDEPLSSIDTRGVTYIDGGNVIAKTITSQQIDTLEFRSAGLATFGGAIMSANFDGAIDAAGNLLDRGTQGFAITQQGQAVLTNLIARDDIQVGAVSEGVSYANEVAQSLADNAEVFRFSLGAFEASQLWPIACKARWRSAGYQGYTDNEDRKRIRRWNTGVKLQWRTATGNTWSGWSTLHTFSATTSTSWQEQSVVIFKQGSYTDVEVRAVVDSSLGTEGSGGSGISASFTNVDDVSIGARALVR